MEAHSIKMSRVFAMAVSPDGKLLVCMYHTGFVVYDISGTPVEHSRYHDDRFLATVEHIEHIERVGVAWTRDCSSIVYACAKPFMNSIYGAFKYNSKSNDWSVYYRKTTYAAVRTQFSIELNPFETHDWHLFGSDKLRILVNWDPQQMPSIREVGQFSEIGVISAVAVSPTHSRVIVTEAKHATMCCVEIPKQIPREQDFKMLPTQRVLTGTAIQSVVWTQDNRHFTTLRPSNNKLIVEVWDSNTMQRVHQVIEGNKHLPFDHRALRHDTRLFARNWKGKKVVCFYYAPLSQCFIIDACTGSYLHTFRIRCLYFLGLEELIVLADRFAAYFNNASNEVRLVSISPWSDKNHLFTSSPTLKQIVFTLMCIRQRLQTRGAGFAEKPLPTLPMEIWLLIFSQLSLCV